MSEQIETSAPPSSQGEFKALEQDDLNGLFPGKPADEAPAVPAEPASAEPAPHPTEEAVQTVDAPEQPQDQPMGTAPASAGVLREIDARQTNTQKRRSQKRWMVVAAVGAAALVFILARSVWLHPPEPGVNQAQLQTAAQASADHRADPKPLSSAAPLPAAPTDDMEDRLQRIDALRAALSNKRTEIDRLRDVYRYGALEVEEELLRHIKRTGGGGVPSAERPKERRIELLLRGIQRRQAYVEGLDKPLRWIDQASEELLFLRRRAAFDLGVAAIAEGLDLEEQMRQIDAALARCAPTAEKLAMPADDSLPRLPVDLLWRRAVEKSKTVTVAEADPRIEAIEEEVCSGDLRRLSDLTRVSLKAARCLAESDAKTLVLNRVADISPTALEKLCEWPGEWLCLNGIKRLTPELAERLFAWPGAWLSLNGVNELSAEAAQLIADWKGRQLELMGLRKVSGGPFLARYEAAGGRLFVPHDVRQEFQGRARSGGEPAAAGAKKARKG
jgi:hypothetical protein